MCYVNFYLAATVCTNISNIIILRTYLHLSLYCLLLFPPAPSCSWWWVWSVRTSSSLYKRNRYSVLPKQNSRHDRRAWLGWSLGPHQSLWIIPIPTSKVGMEPGPHQSLWIVPFPHQRLGWSLGPHQSLGIVPIPTSKVEVELGATKTFGFSQFPHQRNVCTEGWLGRHALRSILGKYWGNLDLYV